MKLLMILVTSVILTSCAISSTPQSVVDQKVEKIRSQAWYQRVERRENR